MEVFSRKLTDKCSTFQQAMFDDTGGYTNGLRQCASKQLSSLAAAGA